LIALVIKSVNGAWPAIDCTTGYQRNGLHLHCGEVCLYHDRCRKLSRWRCDV